MPYIQAHELDNRRYNQSKEVNRKVRKGSHAVYILAPNTAKVEDKKTGDAKVIVTGFHTIAVFPYSATEGEDLPTFDYAPTELPPLWDVASRFNLTVSYGETDP